MLPQIPQGIVDTMTAWGECRGRVESPLIDGPQTAEAIADLAQVRCDAEYQKAVEAYVQALGPSARVRMLSMREQKRAEDATHIKEMRSGAPYSNPALAWVSCLVTYAWGHADSPDEATNVADQAMEACQPFEARQQADLVSRVGQHAADNAFPQVRESFRHQALAGVTEARASKGQAKAAPR